MARIILGVTGSVAAVRTPVLWQTLKGAGHEVRVVATNAATYFFDPDAVEASSPPSELPTLEHDQTFFSDRDEWPGERYVRGDRVLHIDFRKWADLLVVAPLDANTLAKFALGLSDNFLSCLFRGWDFEKPVILAPAMNTLMWQSPVTLRHLRQIFEDHAPRGVLAEWSLLTAVENFERYLPRFIIVPPQAKMLACGDVGIGAMAEVSAIAEAVRAWAEVTSTGNDGKAGSNDVELDDQANRIDSA